LYTKFCAGCSYSHFCIIIIIFPCMLGLF
jgi:hypothetical protein